MDCEGGNSTNVKGLLRKVNKTYDNHQHKLSVNLTNSLSLLTLQHWTVQNWKNLRCGNVLCNCINNIRILYLVFDTKSTNCDRIEHLIKLFIKNHDWKKAERIGSSQQTVIVQLGSSIQHKHTQVNICVTLVPYIWSQYTTLIYTYECSPRYR